MNKTEVRSKIKETGIVPVIRTDSAEKARTIIKALIEGGINVLEITMTIPGAIQLIAELTGEYNMVAVIGAGTVLDAETARRCVAAGAQFIVSPIAVSGMISLCNQKEIIVMPGALTPTEIFAAQAAGADIVKVFPVGAMGGVSYLKSVKAVFPHIEIVPTGGINPENAVDYLKAGALAVGIGSELTSGEASEITKRAQLLLGEIELNQTAKEKNNFSQIFQAN